MTYSPIRCSDCDCVLWSLESQKVKLCPECRGDEEKDYQDLEDTLDEMFQDD